MEIDILDECETVNCTNPAEKITSTETKIIQVCLDCFNRKYATIKVSELDNYIKENNSKSSKKFETIKNFFTEEQLHLCKKYIKILYDTREFVYYDAEKKKENAGSWVINHFVGRINILLNKSDIPTEFLNLLDFYRQKINNNSTLDSVEVVVYSSLYGNPRLDPHIDPPSKRDFMLNIQVDSTLRWPIVQHIDNKNVYTILNNNECLPMDVVNNVHWREPIKINDNDYVVMIFAYFNDESIEPYPQDWYPHPPMWKKNGMDVQKKFTEQVAEVYGTESDNYDKIKEKVIQNYNKPSFFNPTNYL